MGLFSGVHTALEPAAIEKRQIACGSVLQQASLAFLKKSFFYSCERPFMWRAVCVRFVFNRISLLDCTPANRLHEFILNILFFQMNTHQSQHYKFQIENYVVLLCNGTGPKKKKNFGTFTHTQRSKTTLRNSCFF